jgi:hypothetical protein
VLAGVTLRAKFHSKIPYSVEKYIVGISQYAYFSTLENNIGKKANWQFKAQSTNSLVGF